jgi:nitrogen fixation NifU-like protein
MFMDRRKILMSHFTAPVNFGLVDDNHLYKKHLRSDACSDELTIQIDAENQVIKKIHFEGSACVIATSSSDILFSMLENKTFAQAIDLITRYQAMILEGKAADDDFQELVIFDNVHRQKGR